jgi:hypothetical protein
MFCEAVMLRIDFRMFMSNNWAEEREIGTNIASKENFHINILSSPENFTM